MYKVKVNEQHHFEISAERDTLKLFGKEIPLDVLSLRDGSLHFIYKNKSYRSELVSQDVVTKQMVVKINGRLYDVSLEDSFDILLQKMGMVAGQGKIALEVKAPMPGLVLNVTIAIGQHIKKGDSLLVLEAMKMENMLKSGTEGIVKRILVAKGDKVEKNQILIELE
jgi:biotin carboxyl carrier protein